MDVFDAERIEAQGGSIRAFACFKNKFKILPSVQKIVKNEDDIKISSLDTMKEFARRIEDNKNKLRSLLQQLKAEGKTIVGIGAPARSSTVLNYCQIGPDFLDFVAEKSQLKIGKLTPGTHIKVVDDDELSKANPDYALLLSWHLKESIIPKIRDGGFKGKFIIPLPNVEIL